MERVLLLLLGMTMAFPAVGVPLNEQYTLPVVAVVGLLWALSRSFRGGLGPGHAWAAVLLLTFAATSVFRHSLLSYALSLGALTVAVLPLTVRPQGRQHLDALLLGVRMGLVLTLSIAFLQIFLQLLPGRLPLQDFLGEHLTRPQGDFLGYNRPAAGFVEPSHLAIYLSACFALQDLVLPPGPARTGMKSLLALAILLSGSLSGVVILLAYLFARVAAAAVTSRRESRGRSNLAAWAVGAAGLFLVAWALRDNLGEAVESYLERILRAEDALTFDNLASSEGSRLYSYLALLDFWSTADVFGLLLGTGYGNYREFLAQMYGNLSQATSFGRGDIDNMLVAVLLSTGLVGGLAYAAFTIAQFKGVGFEYKVPILVLLLMVNFSYGFLIAPLYWNLMFVLAASASLIALPGSRERRHGA